MVINVQNPKSVLAVITDVLTDEDCRKNWTFYAPPRPEVLGQQWAAMVDNGVGACYALDVPGFVGPVGFLLALFVPCMITGTPQALEYLWIVLPRYRFLQSAVELLDAFEEDAKARGCKQVIVGSSSFVKPEAMRRFYRRRGYVPHAEAFRKQV